MKLPKSQFIMASIKPMVSFLKWSGIYNSKVFKKLYNFALLKFQKYNNHRLNRITVAIADLLFMQHSQDSFEFNRYDIFIRYLAIENYYGLNNFGFDMYAKAQLERIGQDTSETFKNLIKSYEENGYDESSEIYMGSNLSLKDGSHRISLGLYHKIPSINIKFTPEKSFVDYSLDWFKEHNFSNEEISHLTNKYKEVLNSLDLTFTCILWPPVKDLFDEIKKDLSSLCEVISSSNYQYTDAEFENLVRDIYSIDDIAAWKIEKKIEYMKPYEKDVCVLNIKFPNPEYRTKSINNKPISTVVENIKKCIRDKYASRINNYYYDIIIHIADNLEQSRYMDNVFRRFDNLCLNPSLSNKITDLKEVCNNNDNTTIYVLFGSCKEHWDDMLETIVQNLTVLGHYDISYEKYPDGYYNLLCDIFKTYKNPENLGGVEMIHSSSKCARVIVVTNDSIKQTDIYECAMSLNKLLNDNYSDTQHQTGTFIYTAKNNSEYHYLKDLLTSPNNLKYNILKARYEERNKLVERVNQFRSFCDENDIALDNLCIVSGCVLDSLGIRDGNDYDVIAIDEYCQANNDKSRVLESHDYDIHNNKVEKNCPISCDELIQNPNYHYLYAGCKFVNLEVVYQYKSNLLRDQDKRDISLISNYCDKYIS